MADQQQIAQPTEIMTRLQVIDYLQLAAEGGDAEERLRNLIRRQRLPVIKRGRLQRFRRSAIDAWLDGDRVAARTSTPARLLRR